MNGAITFTEKEMRLLRRILEYYEERSTIDPRDVVKFLMGESMFRTYRTECEDFFEKL